MESCVEFTTACWNAVEGESEQARRRELVRLLEQERGYFLHVAGSILHDREDSEDAVQASFIAAWRAAKHFRGEATARTWFKSIVVNQCLSILRKRRPYEVISIDEKPEVLSYYEASRWNAVEDPEQGFVREQLSRMVHARLEQLPKQLQVVMILRFFEGQTVEEIATRTAKTVPSINSHLYRGNRKLKETLADMRYHYRIGPRRLQKCGSSSA